MCDVRNCLPFYIISFLACGIIDISTKVRLEQENTKLDLLAPETIFVAIFLEVNPKTSQHIVYMLLYLEGELMDHVELTEQLAHGAGALAADMSNIMEVR